MNRIKDSLTYFGVSATFIFSLLFLIKYFKEDKIYYSLVIGIVISFIALIGAILIKKEDKNNGAVS